MVFQKIADLIKYLLGINKLPKSFRKFLKEHGDEEITHLEITRTPIDSIATGLMQVLTLGDWNNIKKKAAVDRLFHTALIINKKYTLEKTAIPNLKLGQPVTNDETERLVIPVSPRVGPKSITIAEFIERGMNQMGKDYYTYDGFNNNCQDFISAHLRASSLLSEGIAQFLKQDIKRLIEATPSLSKFIGRKITDLAGYGEGAYEELAHKRGGLVRYAHGGMTKGKKFIM